MAFKFPLESVLKHRQRLEEIAQREFAEAQANVDECLRKIEAMYNRIDEVRNEIKAAQTVGTREMVEQIREMETFISGQKIRIENLRLEARTLLQIAEEKQEALIAAARDKKALVKLKERKKVEYLQYLSQLEQKELDDMTSVRHGWGKE